MKKVVILVIILCQLNLVGEAHYHKDEDDKGGVGFRQIQWTNTICMNSKMWNIPDDHQLKKNWPRHTIDSSSSGADGVKLADINRDGKIDIVTGWEEGGVTKLYLNPGAQHVRENWPTVEVGETPAVEDAVFADMDADGMLDIVSCTENRSEKIFIHWTPKNELLDEKEWHQDVLPVSDGKMMWMYAEPMQIDGKFGVDLIAGGKGDNASIGWFEAPENGRNLHEWKWHEISPVGWIMSIYMHDLDDDGDLDIIVTDRRGALKSCRWLENPGLEKSREGHWESHLIGAEGLEVMFMSINDINGDGLEEMIVAERTHESIRIFRQLSMSGLEWEEKIIHLPKWTGHAKSVEVGDLNGDEIPDFVISTNTDNAVDKWGLIWLDGSHLHNVSKSEFQPVSAKHRAKYDKVELIDLDGDKDLDILICEENFGENGKGLGLIWYENTLQN